MSLSSFSPRPTVASSYDDDDLPQRGYRPRTPTGTRDAPHHGSSPLSNPTLIGQLHRGPLIGAVETSHEELLEKNEDTRHDALHKKQYQHLYVLPVLLLEFLAIALTRAVLPSILLHEYGSSVYLVLGAADCIRGLLAFFACPIFGKLSDVIGRKLCLFVTVLGSCAPVCSLALFAWEHPVSSFLKPKNAGAVITESGTVEDATVPTLPPVAIPLFVILLSLSGIFSSTFTLVFAYISDSVQKRDERVSAYGLALATFGLSFTIGPMAGGYLANYKTDYVFQSTLVLTILDLIYIYLFLPESKEPKVTFGASQGFPGGMFSPRGDASVASATSTTTLLWQVADSISWSPWESIKLVMQDPFLRKVGQVAFFYYTGLWAVISTLSLYAVHHFRLTPERLGELMSALGLSTMVAEAVLVRVMVPLVGEKRAIRIGLLSFALQCVVLGGANEAWQLFICVGFSMLGNLVYPSLSSLISGTVPPESVGEALGAINGIKALTEGLGPLFFGALMTVSEHTSYPGSPYWLAGILVLVSYRCAEKLPANSEPSLYSTLSSPDKYPPYPISSPEEDYIHELEFKRRYGRSRKDGSRRKNVTYKPNNNGDDDDDCLARMFPTPVRDDDDEEYQHLLSEIEESDEYEERPTNAPRIPPVISRGSSSGADTNNANSFPTISIASAPAFPSSPAWPPAGNDVETEEEHLGFARRPAQSKKK